jgi:hypothetical protein
MSGPRGFVGLLFASLLARRSAPRPEVALLHNWWCSAREDQAAREVETQLFFDQTLLNDARQAQRVGSWRRSVAAAVLGVAVWAAPVTAAHAEEPTTVEEDSDPADPAGQIAIWEWIIDIVMQTTGGEGRGSGDPDEG